MLLYAFTTVQHNTSTRYAREGGSTNRPYPPLTHNDEEGWKREKKVKHRTEQSPMHLCHCDESGVVEKGEAKNVCSSEQHHKHNRKQQSTSKRTTDNYTQQKGEEL